MRTLPFIAVLSITVCTGATPAAAGGGHGGGHIGGASSGHASSAS